MLGKNSSVNQEQGTVSESPVRKESKTQLFPDTSVVSSLPPPASLRDQKQGLESIPVKLLAGSEEAMLSSTGKPVWVSDAIVFDSHLGLSPVLSK